MVAGMNSAKMLVEVLQSGEALSPMAFAEGMGTVEGILGTAVFAVDLTFMSKEPATIRESRQFLAALGGTLVWSIMLVHVLAISNLLAADSMANDDVNYKYIDNYVASTNV